MNKRLQEWNKIIVSTADSDFEYLFHIISYQLERMRKYFEKNKNTSQNKETAKQILSAEKLLKRILNPDNVSDYNASYRKLDKKYGKLIIKNGVVVRLKQIKNQEEYRNEMFNANLDRCQAKRDDLKKAFDIISSHVWNWWD